MSHTISVLLGQGEGRFADAITSSSGEWFATSATVADFNGDGKLDLVVVDQGSHTISILLGKGDGHFEEPTQYHVAYGPTYVAVGDFNNDGILDLAVCASSGKVSILLGDGSGKFRGNGLHSCQRVLPTFDRG